MAGPYCLTGDVFQMALMDWAICTLRDYLNCILESLRAQAILAVVKDEPRILLMELFSASRS